jgi:hypothetical protein
MQLGLSQLNGCSVRDSNGHPIGRVTAVYRYAPTLQAPWGAAAVTRGQVLRSTHLVDLRSATMNGEHLVVAHPADVVRRAPSHQALLGDMLAERHGTEVLRHYHGRTRTP